MLKPTVKTRTAALVVMVAIFAAACSGGNGSDTGAEPESGGESGPDVAAVGGVDLGDNDTPSQGLLPATGEELFPCSIGALGDDVITVAFADAAGSDGLAGERFRVALDDYADRCGGALEIVGFDLGDPDACGRIDSADPAITVTDRATVEQVTCVAAGTRGLVWHEAGLASPDLVPETLVMSTDLPASVAASKVVSLLEAEGLLAGRSVTVVHGADADAALVSAGLLPMLDSHVVIEVAADACAEPLTKADMVIVAVDAECLSALVGAAPFAPVWVVVGDDELFDDASGVDFAPIAPLLDGALAYRTLPISGGGWPRSLGPHPRDDACVRYLDDLVGISSAYPGDHGATPPVAVRPRMACFRCLPATAVSMPSAMCRCPAAWLGP